MRLTTYPEKRLNENILSRGAKMTYKANTVFFNSSEDAWKAYYLEKGLVRFLLFSEDGRQRIPFYITAGSAFGEYGLINNLYGATAIAVVDCEVVSFNKEQFTKLINEDVSFAQICINSLVEKLWWMTEQYNAISFMDRFGKIANGLLCLARRWGEPVSLPGPTTGTSSISKRAKSLKIRITHQELAEFTGTNRATVTTVLDVFEAKKIIQKKAKEIVIIDLEKLEQWIV